MGKSIRSKRLRRLRTLKREIVTPHYDLKEEAKLAVQAAALAAPKIQLPNRRGAAAAAGDEPRGRSGATAMIVETSFHPDGTEAALKPKGGVKKRGKSKTRKEIRSKRKKQLKF